MIITDTAGKPKQLKRFLESQEGRDRVARALGPSLLPSGNPGKVLQLVGGMPMVRRPPGAACPCQGPADPPLWRLRYQARGQYQAVRRLRMLQPNGGHHRPQAGGYHPEEEGLLLRHIDIYPFSGGGTASTGPR